MYFSTINRKIDLQLYEFWSVFFKVGIKKQQEYPLWGLIIIHKNTGMGTYRERNGYEKNQKSVGTGPKVNLRRLNNIISLNIYSVCHFFNTVLVTSL